MSFHGCDVIGIDLVFSRCCMTAGWRLFGFGEKGLVDGLYSMMFTRSAALPVTLLSVRRSCRLSLKSRKRIYSKVISLPVLLIEVIQRFDEKL